MKQPGAAIIATLICALSTAPAALAFEDEMCGALPIDVDVYPPGQSPPKTAKAKAQTSAPVQLAVLRVADVKLLQAKEPEIDLKSLKKNGAHEFHGMADYYHHSLYGRKTSSGQVLRKEVLTAAHRTLPFGTRVHVHNKHNGKSCIVTINDRGPFTKSKVIDLSHAAADKIGLLQMGTGHVVCTVLPPGKH